jgi:hypothetical protein
MNDETDGDDDSADDTTDGTADDEAGDEAALEELRREFGDRWDIARMTGGYRAIPRATGGTPIPRYGTTVAELAASIRRIEDG